MTRITRALLLGAAVLAGCAAAPDPPRGPSSSPLASTTDPTLPAASPPTNFGGCVGGEEIGLRLHLTTDPANPTRVVARSNRGPIVEITWPPGYRARFAPGLEIVSPSGDVIARAGLDLADPAVRLPGLSICAGSGGILIYRVEGGG